MIDRICARIGCGTSLVGYKQTAVYCSDACRKAASRGLAIARTTCGYCSAAMIGRYRSAKWCSEGCRKAAARLHGNEESIAYAQILKCDPCAYCGCGAGTVDHITACASGGTSDWWNLTSACMRCNGRKSDRPLLAFMTLLGGVHAVL